MVIYKDYNEMHGQENMESNTVSAVISYHETE